MARPEVKAPSRRYHLSGQSVVTIDGTDFYLGPHDSPEAIARYAVLIATYQQNGLKLPESFNFENDMVMKAALLIGDGAQATAGDQRREIILVRHVTAIFRVHLAEKYAKEPKDKARHERICDQLEKAFGDGVARSFRTINLKEF